MTALLVTAAWKEEIQPVQLPLLSLQEKKNYTFAIPSHHTTIQSTGIAFVWLPCFLWDFCGNQVWRGFSSDRFRTGLESQYGILEICEFKSGCESWYSCGTHSVLSGCPGDRETGCQIQFGELEIWGKACRRKRPQWGTMWHNAPAKAPVFSRGPGVYCLEVNCNSERISRSQLEAGIFEKQSHFTSIPVTRPASEGHLHHYPFIHWNSRSPGRVANLQMEGVQIPGIPTDLQTIWIAYYLCTYLKHLFHFPRRKWLLWNVDFMAFISQQVPSLPSILLS